MIMFLMLAAAADPALGKTMAMDDWHAMTITHVAASDGSGSPLYLRVQAADLDGDGVADEAVVKLACDAGSVSSSSYQIVSPRDVATGQSSGKRMHKPFVITKEWGAASPTLAAMKPTYNVKMQKTARVAAGADGWTPMTLGSTDGLCAATAASAAKVTKTSSNIQNN